MQSATTGWAGALLLLLLIPQASAFVEGEGRLVYDDCTNNGVIVQFTLTGSNQVNCKGECVNNGVLVQLGAQSGQTCQGACTNNGVMVYASGGCHGSSIPGACVGETCSPITTPPVFNQRAKVEATCGFELEGPKTLILECGRANSSGDCSVVGHPTCWSVRFGCGLVYNYGPLARDIIDNRTILRCILW